MSEEDHFKTHHEDFMIACLELALISKQSGNSPVGSVIVKDGGIVARGLERVKEHNDLTYHAEMEAIRGATEYLNSQDLSSCTLYSTHEPCVMCSYVIRHTKIKTVVIGSSSGELGGVHSSYPLLLDKKIKTWGKPPKLIQGILKKDCEELQG
jgi:tRNA(adenine34) deaminase